MRLVSAFCLTALFALSAANASDPSMKYYQPHRAISPIADATFSDGAPAPVPDGISVEHSSVTYDAQPATHAHGGCSECGQHHYAPQVYYYQPAFQPARKQGFFGQMMDIERRKNRWLLSKIR